MRLRIYQFLVNRQPGISGRYHKFHDKAGRVRKYVSWLYLLWLNFAFYILGQKKLGLRENVLIYESRELNMNCAESKAYYNSFQRTTGMTLEPDAYIQQLAAYDVISFDIFDTLIFRPFSSPTDLFYMLGTRFSVLNFKEIRMQAEWECRQEAFRETGSYEIKLADIWRSLEDKIGIDAEEGMREEMELEMAICYANPFMKALYQRLIELGKKIVIISDMYLSADFLDKMLKKNGYGGYEALYVSCEYGCNKGTGDLFRLVKREFGEEKSCAHIGDNRLSDIEMSRKAGFDALYYPNGNLEGDEYRAKDMSVIVGGAYRGIVNHLLYSGAVYSMEYEYGLVYGGLFVLGYCGFIHDYYKTDKYDKILFLSRDGDILRQAYCFLYPEDRTEYVYWSRKAATKLEFFYDRQDYFRRFVYHKVNQNISLEEIFRAMELEELGDAFGGGQESLTDKNAKRVEEYILRNRDYVISKYEEQDLAARKYYECYLENCSAVLAVDIGWAGSGALVLSHLIEKRWKLGCKVTGLVAGTNTIHNAEADASESFLQDGKLAAYLYSQSHNRDLLKKHDPNKNYNIFWELLLSSPTPQFSGFYPGKRGKPAVPAENPEDAAERMAGAPRYLPEIDVTLEFGKYDKNIEGIREIQKGILNFVKEYHSRFEEFPYMEKISGRDAYAPMLVAASCHEKYLKSMEKRFDLEVNVN